MKKTLVALISLFALTFPFLAASGDTRGDAFKYDLAPTVFVPRSRTPFSDPSLRPSATKESNAWALRDYDLDPRNVDVEPAQIYFQNAKIKDNSFENNLFNASLLSFVGLNVVDYFTTEKALRYMGVSEGNPLLNDIAGDSTKFAAFKLGVTAFSYWNMKSLFKKNKTLAWVLSVASNALMYYAVSCNIDVINKATIR